MQIDTFHARLPTGLLRIIVMFILAPIYLNLGDESAIPRGSARKHLARAPCYHVQRHQVKFHDSQEVIRNQTNDYCKHSATPA